MSPARDGGLPNGVESPPPGPGARVDQADTAVHDLLANLARDACASLHAAQAVVNLTAHGGQLEHSVTHGVDPGAAEAIGKLPVDRGVLAGVATTMSTVRTADVSSDPRFEGLSEHPGGALLGVPLVLRGRGAGALFVCAPEGRAEFSEADERRAESLVRDAAAAIESTRTMAENQRRERWYTRAGELAKELVFGRHKDPLHLVAERVVEVADADLVLVIRRGSTDDAEPVVVASAGAGSPRWLRVGMPVGHGLTAHVLATGRPMNVPHLADLLPEALRSGSRIDSLAVIPLAGTTRARMVLTIGRYAGRRPLSASEMGMATMFAGQTALALELAGAQVHRDHVALLEERDRIARDLHDHVIQQLFATGMAMDSASRSLEGPAADVVRTSIDHIDDTIKQIRATIYQLTVPILPGDSTLRARAIRLLDDLEPTLGFRPSFTVDGPAEFGVDEELVEDCVAVLRETLTNVARHAEASVVDVSLVVTETRLNLTVRDDGRGMGDTTRRSGLANLRARAERHGGSLAIRSQPGDGTRLIWSVPLGALE